MSLVMMLVLSYVQHKLTHVKLKKKKSNSSNLLLFHITKCHPLKPRTVKSGSEVTVDFAYVD